MSQPDGTPRKRVLVLEDDEAIQALLQFALADAGLEAVPAPNAADALRGAQEASPDLIVFDMHLELSGAIGPVIGRLRQIVGAGVPLLAMSGLRHEEIARDLGAYDFVLKPFDIDELLASVRRGLEMRTTGGGMAV